ncbi:unnamed protein product [Moneuplotes crassus]|uniref:Uncharacterized protein n=1 Tax=Euplotes crassus TaxID=5936 RepID=A0AAD1XR36_EUPCR|nr:unnamed protein product [Moneuplotes crassus]
MEGSKEKMLVTEEYINKLYDQVDEFEEMPRTLRLNREYLYYKYGAQRKRTEEEVLPLMKELDFAWAIDGYDQYKDEIGSWEVTFNFQASEIPSCMFPVKAQLDLTEYPEKKPGIKLSINQTYLFGGSEEDVDEDILDQAKDYLKEILAKIDYTSEDGTVHTDQMDLECKVEGDDDDDDEDDGDEADQTSFPLQHIINKIGLSIHQHLS